MNLNELLDEKVVQIYGEVITVGELCLSLLSFGALLTVFRLTFRRWLPRYFRIEEISLEEQRRTRRLTGLVFILLLAAALLPITGLNPMLYEGFTYYFRTSTLIVILAVFFAARLVDRIISRILAHNYSIKQEAMRNIAPNVEASRPPLPPRRMAQPLIYLGAVFLLFGIMDFNLSFTFATVQSSFSQLLQAVIILVGARFLVWIVSELALFPYFQNRSVDIGAQYAVNQLLKYVIYTLALLWALEVAGLKLTLLWGGAAALLVGLGLGLQQTFIDLVCGVILLSERAVEVGDVLDVDGLIGTVRKIGLRTSLVETRDNRTVILPNSKLVADKVVNWSHDELKARFTVSVGVAYGSDTELVRKILLQVAEAHPKSLKKPAPFVRFMNFGDSSLDFELFFWSREFLKIEDVRSDMRFEIDRLFRENNVTIPFPQRDVWMR